MTPDAFITTWQANTRNEAAASKAHFLDLCALLGVPTPQSDPTGATYAFEKGVKKAAGGGGWADVWKRGCFGWEYKSRGHDLEKAHDQLLRYAGALENPPLLISSDMERIIVRTNWTNAVSERREFDLEDLRDPTVRALLKTCWTDPERWRPAVTRQMLTEKAAGDFAELARRLRERGHNPQTVAHFVNRLVFCLFADDVGLLPERLLDGLLDYAGKSPANFAPAASELFRAMRDRGGRVGFQAVQWFNGGLFDDDTALPLDTGDIALLTRMAALDWAEIDPSIFGTLFERGLDPDKRSQLGAHYTDRDKIGLLVDAVVVQPLLAEWGDVRTKIAEAMTKRAAIVRQTGDVAAAALVLAESDAVTAKSSKARKTMQSAATSNRRRQTALLTEAQGHYIRFMERLRAFRVLDPACGSGNFLYLSLLALKDLELRFGIEAETLGLEPGLPMIGPEAVLGIEINPYATELARVSVWIGHIQWARRNGFPPPSDPVLRALHTIENRDAVLAEDGTPAEWPKADAIVGNPPFLGDKVMIANMGEDYTNRLRHAYAGRVPGGADLVCYWFEKAWEAIESGNSDKAGLVATQSIRKGANRTVLDKIKTEGIIFDTWPDEPWNLDGAAVRVSLVSFAKTYLGEIKASGKIVGYILSDLTSNKTDLTTAKFLNENSDIAAVGSQKNGDFDIPGDVARSWLLLPKNANGRSNSDVIKPWRNGSDLTYRPADNWIIDFGTNLSEFDASFYSAPFGHTLSNVKSMRQQLRREAYRKYWWRHAEPRPGMRNTLIKLRRYIATPRVAKHRIFVWLDISIIPDTRLVIFARDDDTSFGVLQSYIHECWSLSISSRHGVGNDPTYNHATCFGTFPFPEGLTPNIPATAYENDPRAQRIAQAARELVAARDRWLNPADLVDIVPEVVPGFPDRILPKNEAAAKILKTRTLTALYNTRGTPEGAWLDNLHRNLDQAVAAAYGWPEDISTEDALSKLLALNHIRTKQP